MVLVVQKAYHAMVIIKSETEDKLLMQLVHKSQIILMSTTTMTLESGKIMRISKQFVRGVNI